MEAVQGCRKTITYEADTFCGTCSMCFCSFHWWSSPFVLVFNPNIYFVFADGSGVPPGTVPKTCKTCKGSGVVSILCQHILPWHVSYRSAPPVNNRWYISKLIPFTNSFCFCYSKQFFFPTIPGTESVNCFLVLSCVLGAPITVY